MAAAGTFPKIAEDMMTSVVEHGSALIDGAPGEEFELEPVMAARRRPSGTVAAVWFGFPLVPTRCGRVRPGDMVDPKHTPGASTARAILKGQR